MRTWGSGLDITVNDRSPIVEGEFPLDGSRFEGTFPPIVGPGPSFSLRKKASRVFTLAEYLAAGSIKPQVIEIIHDAVVRRQNIVVVGGTSSGKTTFVNAVIEPAEAFVDGLMFAKAVLRGHDGLQRGRQAARGRGARPAGGIFQ